jgi:hypothetical protein|tara:strand:- start:1204 stop:2004 length:801 start_codon:yes stop_codon:yes gene_type:complete
MSSISEIAKSIAKGFIYDIQHKRKFDEQLSRIKNLKNRYSGERCFIIGNGPSIKNQNLTLLKNEKTFITNHFIHHEQLSDINPSFYCASDSHFFLPNIDLNWINNLKLLPHKADIFLSYRASRAVKNSLFKKLKNNVYLLRYHPKKIWLEKKINFNLERPLFTGDTVIIDFCFPIAVYMGFKTIYLLGVDSNYNLDNDEEIKYGFPSNNITTKRRSNFYLKNIWQSNVMKSYKIIDESSDVEIIDLTNNGSLDVFPKESLDNILEK